MRKFLMGLMMASALVPAAASAQDAEARAERARDRGDRTERPAGDRPERRAAQQREQRQQPTFQRAERPERTERAERTGRADRPDRTMVAAPADRRGDRDRSDRQRRDGRSNEGFSDWVREVASQPTRTESRDRRGGDRRWSDNDRRDDRGRDGSRDRDDHRRWSGSDRRDGQRWNDNDRRDGVRTWRGANSWRGDWRQDRRYSWQRYRDQNRSLFRVGRYNDPYGWGYRRLSIGFSLGSGYYGSRYWLNDPWQYRLPPAYGPYRWVRYYDDALLVNIYTGQVVDVVHSFFW